jgi:hypothetical protein
MSTGALIGIIIAVIVVVAVIVVASVGLRRARLRRQFGPEYDRLAQKLGSRKQADAELTARQKRVHGLGIHELSADQQASYSGDWTAVQERFVDTPADAVDAADTLIWSVMRDRGYPANDRNTSMDALSVYHPSSLEGYRKTQEVSLEAATTEQLREAMIRYRAMFEDLTGLKEAQSEPRQDRVAEIRDRAATNSAAADADVRDEQVPVTEAPAAGTRAAGTRAADDDVTARDLAAENSERTADTPR